MRLLEHARCEPRLALLDELLATLGDLLLVLQEHIAIHNGNQEMLP